VRRAPALLLLLACFVFSGCGIQRPQTKSFVFAQSYPGANISFPEGGGEPPNDPCIWNTTPAPTFVEGVVGSYDVGQNMSDPESDTLTLANESGPGCLLPTGQTIDDPNNELDEDGTSPDDECRALNAGPRYRNQIATLSCNILTGFLYQQA